MTIKSFFKLVEIQTKVASVTPFLLGAVYSLYHFNSLDLRNFILMFISLLFIDMATTSINNYIDYKMANKKQGFGYESHNAIVRDNIKERTVVVTIVILLTIAIFFGILLYLNTNFVVLLLGAVSFIIGVLYSFGPIPISRTPFGEIFSGFFMGSIIPFIAVYIHVYEKPIFDIIYTSNNFTINLNIPEVLKILLITIPAVVGIANIMLANNICDIEDDIENRRYTLPIFIGKNNSLKVYTGLYYLGYLSIVLALIFNVLPIISVITLLTFIIVNKNIKSFYKLQSKKETFVLAVNNFVYMNLILVLSILLDIILEH